MWGKLMTLRKYNANLLPDPERIERKLDRQEMQRALADGMLIAASESVKGKRAWFVLSVVDRREQRIEEYLLQKNICAWVPMRKGRSARYKRRGNVERYLPALPGYVFVRVVPSDYAFVGLLSVEGVTGILSMDGRPTAVKDRIISNLRHLVDDGAFNDPDQTKARNVVKKGDRVEINHGSFEMVKAIVQGYRGGDMVRCVATLFGGKAFVSVPIAKIKKIE